MRNRYAALAALGALGAAATVVAPVALSGDGDRGHRGYRVIELSSTPAQFAELELAPAETLDVGDGFAFSDDLWHHGEKIGDDGGSCVVVRIEGTSGLHHCVATWRLPEGQITAQGLVPFDIAQGETADAPFTVAVTGGTGAFRTARGELDVVPAPDGSQAITFRLIR
jgi:hypothetical protein